LQVITTLVALREADVDFVNHHFLLVTGKSLCEADDDFVCHTELSYSDGSDRNVIKMWATNQVSLLHFVSGCNNGSSVVGEGHHGDGCRGEDVFILSAIGNRMQVLDTVNVVIDERRM